MDVKEKEEDVEEQVVAVKGRQGRERTKWEKMVSQWSRDEVREKTYKYTNIQCMYGYMGVCVSFID